MKIIVMNTSGNVGKSTITKELLYTRLEKDCRIIEVESVNSSNIRDENLNIVQYLSDDIDDIYLEVVENENIIIDVGASNVESLFVEIQKIDSFLDEIDYFVIPSVPQIKEIEDTIKTVNFLISQEVEEDKIKILPNFVKKDNKREFAILYKNSQIAIDEKIYIKESKLFSNLKLLGVGIKDIYQDDLNFYKSKIINAEDKKTKMKYLKMDISNRLAHTIIAEFDFIFESLFNVEITKKQLKQKTTDEDIELESTEESEDF